ncbi:MAG: DUF465 domain-containing protein [Deltaproteobacteria bacterium]|nr:DUF465 domain-containing protein [Deltaproteobacteria bacterium]
MPDFSVLKEELIESDPNFRRLHDDHQGCEKRLAELIGKSLRSPEDEVEEKRIKLHKLRLKDEMEAILHNHSGVLAPA